MEQHISQEETRRIIISDMVKKRGTIVPIIGDDTIVYRGKKSGEEIPFQKFILREFQKKCPHVEVSDADMFSMKERGYYGLLLMSHKFLWYPQHLNKPKIGAYLKTRYIENTNYNA